MAPHTYEPPVDALLRCGECQGASVKDWPNYVQEFGLTADHVYNTKISLVGGFGKIAETFPELRDRCVEVLTRLLSHYKHHHRSVNGALVTELFKLKATEPDSVAAMEEAYNAKKVDEMFVGSWARVQVDLGLKQKSDFTPEELSIHYTPQQEQMMANIKALTERLERQQTPSPQNLPRHVGTKPPDFSDIAAQKGGKKLSEKSGFGSGSSSSKKGKKKRGKM